MQYNKPMNATSSHRAPARPLWLSLSAILLFAPAVATLEHTRTAPPLFAFMSAGLALGLAGTWSGFSRLRTRPAGKAYGFAVGGGIAGLFALLFWGIMVPLLLLFALPARQLEPNDPDVAEAQRQMRVIVRQVKSFHRELGRMPVKVEELVEKDYLQARVLYDPRDRMRDTPSFRLLLREMPPEDQWHHTPLLESRFPDRYGRRLLAFPDESFQEIDPTSPSAL